jgi:phage baseplate assembly protein W
MSGMNRATGRAITAPLEHLRQSIGDILMTPIGERAMRREYGSQVPLLVDQPDNQASALRIVSAAAAALMRWEPRLALNTVTVARDPERPGSVRITVEGDLLSPAAARARALKLTVAVGGASP